MKYNLRRYVQRKRRGSVSEEEYNASEKRRSEEISEANFQEIYRRYRRDYKLRANRMERKGRQMDTAMLDENQFFQLYDSSKNDMISESWHKRKKKDVTPQQVIDRIVSDQMYDISIRQARAYRELLSRSTDDWDSKWKKRVVKNSYIDRDGVYHAKGDVERIPINEENIRADFFGKPIFDDDGKLTGFTDVLGDLFQNIRDFREREFEKGRSAEDIRNDVRETFFGSK